MTGTLVDAYRWWSHERSADLALVTPTDELTYAALGTWSDNLRDWLLDRGLRYQDRITILAANSMEWCVLAQAAVRAGAILAPLNPRFTLSEASFMADRYHPIFLFHDAARGTLARELAESRPWMRLEKLESIASFRGQASKSATPRPEILPDSKVVIIATSGSTARPKGVVYSHRTMLNYLLEYALAEPRTTDRPRLLLFAPLCTSAGYVLLTQFLAYGGTLFVDEAFDPGKALRRIKHDGITALMGAPVFFERIAAHPEFESVDFSRIRMASVGGARVSKQLLDTYMKKGTLLRQIYGQTEAGGQCTINTVDASKTRPEQCGHGMPFTRMAIIDSQGNVLPPNTPGEIVVKGPAIMVEYWQDPEATARTLVDGWLRTGDQGVIDENGQLTMLDRLKDIIISGGLNISAAELERVISEYPGVAEVAVIAAKDERFGETPMAVVYASSPLEVPGLIAHCNTHLSDFKVPRYVVTEPEPLPRLATGKIAKPALRSKYADAHLRLTRVR